MIGGGLLDGVEIGALDILDDGEFERLGVGHLAHHHRHVVELGHLGRAPAPLARDDLELICHALHRAHQDGLQNALLADGIGQIVKIAGRRKSCVAESGSAAETRRAGCVWVWRPPRAAITSSPIRAERPRPKPRSSRIRHYAASRACSR